jgi:hypothetical protein
MNRGGKKRRGHEILTGVLGTEAEEVPCSYGEKTDGWAVKQANTVEKGAYSLDGIVD